MGAVHGCQSQVTFENFVWCRYDNSQWLVYLAGGYDGNAFSDKFFKAKAPAMNLYFKDGNATAEASCPLGMADGSVTLGQLAPDSLAKLGLDHNPATAGVACSLSRTVRPPAGYSPYKRFDRNGALKWEEQAPISIARHIFDGVEVLNELYVAGVRNSASASIERLEDTIRPVMWQILSSIPEGRSHASTAVLNGKLYIIGGRSNGVSLSTARIFNPGSSYSQWFSGIASPGNWASR